MDYYILLKGGISQQFGFISFSEIVTLLLPQLTQNLSFPTSVPQFSQNIIIISLAYGLNSNAIGSLIYGCWNRPFFISYCAIVANDTQNIIGIFIAIDVARANAD